ncbi:MAG TPA: antitoxin MazE-like protein [Acidobacteriaceae bacterium]|nr:antitoxin MazE-like protein [Acidobacteriaceae bacterium]
MAKPRAETSFTFRIDTRLKQEFLKVTEKENKPGSQVLRDLMAAYIQRKKRKEFEAEARRQSRLIASSPDEAAVMDWISDVADTEAWK